MNKSGRKLFLLGLGLLLVIILAINAWLFLPRFLLSHQIMTAEDLRQIHQQLETYALESSNLFQNHGNSEGKTTLDTEKLEAIQHEIDLIIVQIKNRPHTVEFDTSIKETLKLAEVLSFTIHSQLADPRQDPLLSLKTSQILRQISAQVPTLPTD